MSDLNFFNEQLESLLEFSEVTSVERLPDPYLQELAADYQAQHALLQSVWAAFQRQGYGLTLKHKQREQWCFVLPDASHPGSVRYQVFDRDGFAGHCTYKTDSDVLIEAIVAGFVDVVDRGVLERLSRTDRWAIGSAKLDLLTRLNSGAITHDDYLKQLGDINQQGELNEVA